MLLCKRSYLGVMRRLQTLPEFDVLLAFSHQTTSIDMFIEELLPDLFEMVLVIAKSRMFEFAIATNPQVVYRGLSAFTPVVSASAPIRPT